MFVKLIFCEQIGYKEKDNQYLVIPPLFSLDFYLLYVSIRHDVYLYDCCSYQKPRSIFSENSYPFLEFTQNMCGPVVKPS